MSWTSSARNQHILSGSKRLLLRKLFISAVCILHPAAAIAFDGDLLEKVNNVHIQALISESCSGVLGHSRLGVLRDDGWAGLSEEELGQETLRIMVMVFLGAYAHGREISYSQAGKEIEKLCLANPELPLMKLQMPAIGDR
jgi:hypothetical protein